MAVGGERKLASVGRAGCGLSFVALMTQSDAFGRVAESAFREGCVAQVVRFGGRNLEAFLAYQIPLQNRPTYVPPVL